MKINIVSTRPNRGAPPALSSRPYRFIALALVSSTALTATAACGQPSPSVSPSLQMVQPTQPSFSTDPTASAIYQWKALSQSDTYSFSTYASFLLAHPGYPDAMAMRRNAERMMRAGGESSDQVVAYFRRYPALTSAGNLRFAEALAAKGLRDEARTAARTAWVGGALTPEDESRLLTGFADAIQPGDNDKRMDRLLWDRSTVNAARQLVLVSPAKRSVFDARLAMLTKAPDAASKSGIVYDSAKNDAGFLADRNWWQRNTGQFPASRDTLAAPRALIAPPTDPDKWLDTLYITAKAANNDLQYATAFNIARQLGDT